MYRDAKFRLQFLDDFTEATTCLLKKIVAFFEIWCF